MIPSKIVCGLALVKTLTRTSFCSSINILGTQRADTFLIPKSSDTIRCALLQLMLMYSAMCLIVRRLFDNEFGTPVTATKFPFDILVTRVARTPDTGV